MQHFYNTHVFKSSMEACREEGVLADLEIEYADNVPCIDLISSLRTGLLSMVDVECSLRGTADSYVQKARMQHKTSPRSGFEPEPSGTCKKRKAFRLTYAYATVPAGRDGTFSQDRNIEVTEWVSIGALRGC
ncbi:hypothetical protein HPB50_022146 [Hyalomma asiaticum]|uniref:Uncharacterized protein n=1 Tax=Hyalomma asiaticum TaxID=266040 RepID=A0ACB7TF72_HYAAI|nr:hypothetical protein HPB50_022146 [Hyalomma asiaticum]